MKFQELQNKTVQELQELLKGQRVHLGKLCFELSNKSLKNTNLLQKTKKDIAKIFTAMKKSSRDK